MLLTISLYSGWCFGVGDNGCEMGWKMDSEEEGTNEDGNGRSKNEDWDWSASIFTFSSPILDSMGKTGSTISSKRNNIFITFKNIFFKPGQTFPGWFLKTRVKVWLNAKVQIQSVYFQRFQGNYLRNLNCKIFLLVKETLSIITENTQPDELILRFGMNYFHIKHLCLTI